MNYPFYFLKSIFVYGDVLYTPVKRFLRNDNEIAVMIILYPQKAYLRWGKCKTRGHFGIIYFHIPITNSFGIEMCYVINFPVLDIWLMCIAIDSNIPLEGGCYLGGRKARPYIKIVVPFCCRHKGPICPAFWYYRYPCRVRRLPEQY